MQGSNAPQERQNPSHKQDSRTAGDLNGNGHLPSSDAPGSTPGAMPWPEYEDLLEAAGKIDHVKVEEFRLKWVKAAVNALLHERKVNLRLKVLKHCLIALVVLTAIGLSIALFIASTAFFSFSLLVGGSVALRRLTKTDGRGLRGNDPEGDP